MSRKPRKPTRGLVARKISPRASGGLTDDSEKLMSSATESSKENKVNPADGPHSRPKLPPTSHHDYSVHEISNVPAPIPDTGLPPPPQNTTTLTTSSALASQTTVALNESPSHSHVPSKSTFVPLPYLKTQNLTEVEKANVRSSSVSHPMLTVRPVTTTVTGISSPHPSPQSNTFHLSITAIIALAVGGGLTLLVMIVLVKLIKRPRRRRTPTPSLPILHDGTFPDGDRVESEGSPIFGGKERLSPTIQARNTKGNTGLWTWTQYNSGIPKPAPTVTVTRSSSQHQVVTTGQTSQQGGLGLVDNDASCIQRQNQEQYLFTGHGNSNATSKAKNPIPLQPVQNAITRAVSRLSTVSMSLYPNSPGGYSQLGGDVGVAIDGVLRDDAGSVEVARYKDRMMGSRNRTSMIAPGNARDAAALRRSQSFAYGGMEPISPSVASPGRMQSNGGRARIKSMYYTPGSYPRASATTGNCDKRHLDRDKQERQVGVDGGGSRRGRELTTALGLGSPIPPSPQPTLYPDDSMSVIGEAKKVTLTGRCQKKPVPKRNSHCDSPPSDNAAVGSLMMVEFAASKSTASLVNIRACEAARGQVDTTSVVKSSLKKRVEDRPPRVPSPPPMPSLAQMAMQHADPEGYGEYHSPTYSIYGLYDGGRGLSSLSYGYST